MADTAVDLPVRDPAAAVDLAFAAQDREDWNAALFHWRAARDCYEAAPGFWAAEIAMLLLLGRLNDAASFAAAACARFPDSMDVAAQRLNVAMALADWPQASGFWADMRLSFPDHPYVQSNGDAISKRLAEGLAAMPEAVLLRAAHEAGKSGAWGTACAAWGALHARLPEDRNIIIGYGHALSENACLDAADSVLSAGLQRLPEDVEIAAHHAQVPAKKQDWVEAARRWQKLLRQSPDTAALWEMASAAYREAGLFEPAEQLLARAIAADPERVDLRVNHAMLAERQEDWHTALARWNTALAMRPEDLNIRNSRGDAIWRVTAARLENGETSPAPPLEDQAAGAAAQDVAAWKRLALQFESLGDACDFGIVQRRLGAEPIGLFRFAAISPENLIALLDERFERLGNPDFTELSLAAGDEYMLRDTRGLYHMHSFTRSHTVDAAKFLQQQVRRIGYLKAKLIEDLESGSKIFVYKSSPKYIEDSTAQQLHAALQRFGRNRLLVIRKAHAQHPAGSMEMIGPGLMAGYIEMNYGSEDLVVDVPSWRSVLQLASRNQPE
jgi:tetratricopeptide (TPR) repeat protein